MNRSLIFVHFQDGGYILTNGSAIYLSCRVVFFYIHISDGTMAAMAVDGKFNVDN